jgi:hypothetical protein
VLSEELVQQISNIAVFLQDFSAVPAKKFSRWKKNSAAGGDPHKADLNA